MKGTTLYGKPTGKGGFTKGDLTVSRTGNDNMADGRAKSSAFQKPGAPGVWDTVKKTAKKVSKKVKSTKAYKAASEVGEGFKQIGQTLAHPVRSIKADIKEYKKRNK